MPEILHLKEPLNFDSWTERASSSGKLATNPAGKTPIDKYASCLKEIGELEGKSKSKALIASQIEKLNNLKSELTYLKAHKDDIILSQTAKSHLKEVYWSIRTGVKPEFFSKYTENGTLAEDASILLISELDDPDLFEMGSPVYEKCDLPRQFNNHFEGNCDIKKSPTIQDIKTCWDIFTFYPHIEEVGIENLDYECQGQVYLELYGEFEFWLRYCLVDMPLVLLESEFRKIGFALGSTSSDEYMKACDEFRSKHTFSHLPLSARVVTFKIKRDNEKYLDLCKRVEVARVFLNEYAKEMFYFENPTKRLISAPIEINDSVIYQKDVVIGEVIKDNIIENTIVTISSPLVNAEIEWKDSFEGGYSENIIDGWKEVISNSQNSLPISDNINNYEVLGIDISNSDTGGTSETPFPNILDEIQPTEEIQNKLDENIAEIVNSSQELNDEFLSKINSLSTIDEAVEFYMDNCEKIDDSKYEPYYMAKKESLSQKLEEPKIKKPVQSPNKANISIPSIPEKVYTGDERYDISDGINVLKPGLTFEESKNFIVEYLNGKLKEWNDLTIHRNNVTTFYSANREVIDRDLTFKDLIAKMSKDEYDKLIEKRRAETLAMASKM